MKTPVFVALLDVLGFASLVAADRDGERLNAYLQCIERSLGTTTPSSAVRYVVFSDSIVLTTNDDTEESLLSLIWSCSRLS